MTAVEIAAAVRSGQRSARSVVDEYLGAIAGGDSDIHAFNLVISKHRPGLEPTRSTPRWPRAKTQARWPACPWPSKTTCVPGGWPPLAPPASWRAGSLPMTPPWLS